MKTRTKLSLQILSIILCFAMLLSYLPATLFTASAADYEYEGGAGTKVADLDTSLKYSDSLTFPCTPHFSPTSFLLFILFK